jgi:hypothetical protein
MSKLTGALYMYKFLPNTGVVSNAGAGASVAPSEQKKVLLRVELDCGKPDNKIFYLDEKISGPIAKEHFQKAAAVITNAIAKSYKTSAPGIFSSLGVSVLSEWENTKTHTAFLKDTVIIFGVPADKITVPAEGFIRDRAFVGSIVIAVEDICKISPPCLKPADLLKDENLMGGMDIHAGEIINPNYNPIVTASSQLPTFVAVPCYKK